MKRLLRFMRALRLTVLITRRPWWDKSEPFCNISLSTAWEILKRPQRKDTMTNQSIVDDVESALPPLPIGLREKILDAVWFVLSDERKDDDGDELD